MARSKLAAAVFLFAAPILRAQDAPSSSPQPPAPDRPAAPNLNLLGRADTNSGESRRNENVQFNLVDNNALKDLNVRLGTTATLIDEFRADRSTSGPNSATAPRLLSICRPQDPLHFTAPCSLPTSTPS